MLTFVGGVPGMSVTATVNQRDNMVAVVVLLIAVVAGICIIGHIVVVVVVYVGCLYRFGHVPRFGRLSRFGVHALSVFILLRL